MFWIILISILLLLILGLLLTPFRLYIRSDRSDYRLEWGQAIGTRLIPQPNDLKLVLRIFFWKKEWSAWSMLFQKKPKAAEQKKEEAEKKKAAPKKRRSDPRKMMRRIRRVLGSLRVRRWKVRLDTDNYILNAYLFPVFYLVNQWYQEWSINYEGETEIDVELEARPIWVLWALLR